MLRQKKRINLNLPPFPQRQNEQNYNKYNKL